MQAGRRILLTAQVSKAEVIQALKLLFPTVLDIQGLPSSGVGVNMTGDGINGFSLEFATKLTETASR